MSIETKAALQTLKFVGSIVLASVAMLIVSSIFGPEVVSWLLIVSLIVAATWVVYSINLSSLKYKEKDQKVE